MKRKTRSPNDPVRLSARFKRALLYASHLHGGKLRKKTKIPDIAHILGVTAIALEYGASQTEAIAALLHDAVEDAGGEKRLHDIERRFGAAVAKIVEGCSDPLADSKRPWVERKRVYVAHVPEASESTRLVSAADKLQNVRSLLRNYRNEGEQLWHRYSGGKEAALWYYRALVNAFRGKRIGPLVRELDLAVTELEAIVNKGIQVRQPPTGNRGSGG